MNLEKLKYPIGTYAPEKNPSQQQLKIWLDDLETFPASVEKLVDALDNEMLNWRYRPDGWTIKQVVHHCADSHMNSIIRFKLALTEDKPTIRPYFEDRWALLPDSQENDLTPSLQILKAVHFKLVLLLKTLTNEQLQREFIHPEHGKIFNVAETIGNYAWHSNHHLAHIKQALQFKNNF